MGYVPPTFEEFCNPALLEARLRRQEARKLALFNAVWIIAWIIAIVVGLALALAR